MRGAPLPAISLCRNLREPLCPAVPGEHGDPYAGSVSEAASTEEGKPAGKGRPTPKRDEARKKRRAAAPTNRKEAAALRRQRLREQRATQRQALVTGDERNLPPRDAGPARRMARDLVDSRFGIGQIFFGLVLAVLAVSFIRNTYVQAITNLAMLLLLLFVVGDAFRVGRRVRRQGGGKDGDKDRVGLRGQA